MVPERSLARACLALLFVAAPMLVAVPAAYALRLLDYNVLNYPGNSGPTRDPYFRTIISPLAPDVFVAEEMTSQSGVNEFLASLNTINPGEWSALPFVDGNDTDAAIFYKTVKFSFADQWSFYPNPANHLRLVHVFVLRPAGYTTHAADIRFYALHLKASTGSANVAQRLAETTGLRDSMNAMPAGMHGFATGDFNFYTVEGGLAKMLEPQADNDGRLYDPLGFQTTTPWQDNLALASVWTQSPCLSGGGVCASGASTGGLDDRFDLWLPTLNWNDGEGYELIPGSYVSVGNDGLHHNLNITDPPTIPEGSAYATALQTVSDHLPIRIDIQVPAIISLPASLAFGSVIVGASASQNLAVSNPAVPPAAALDYTLAAPPGFSAPSGPFVENAGAPPASSTIQMSTATAAALAGNLTVTSDAADTPTAFVALSGTVLDHAAASLDSASVQTAEALDFGDHASGQFGTMLARVHDFGYDPLQAQLAVSGAAFAGGDGRFSIAGGFSPSLVAGTGTSYALQFNDAGATLDQEYTGTLTLSSADEPLPGASAQPDLVVSLRAKVTSGTTGVEPGFVPTTTAFYAPFPNPLAGRTSFRFDLDHATPARLEVFDLAGRRVALIADRDFSPGRYTEEWAGQTDAGGTLGAGLYFARLTVPGVRTHVQRLAIVR